MLKQSILPSQPRHMTPEVWNLIFFFLDDIHEQKLCLTGDKSMEKLLEHRTSSFCSHLREHASWRDSLASLSRLRILQLRGANDLSDRQSVPSLEAISWPKTLVNLSLPGNYYNFPFLVFDPTEIGPHIEKLDNMFPNLRILSAKGRYYENKNWWTLPSRLTHFSGRCGRIADNSLPSGLISLNIKYVEANLPRLPATLEKLQVDTMQRFLGETLNPDLLDALAFPELRELLIGHCTELQADWLFRKLPKTLTMLSIHCRRPSLPTIAWIPPKLRSLHTSYGILPSEYRELPRSLTRVSTGYRRVLLNADPRWEVAGGIDPLVHNTQEFPSRPTLTRLSGSSSGGLLDIPPALQHVRIGSTPPEHMPDFLEHLSTHFIPGLTSLDMRTTRNIDSSQFAHFPVTLTSLKFQAISLPKVKLLSRLPKLVKLGLWSGTLTTSIAKAIPDRIKFLTLHHIALITKGYHQPSGDPTQHVRYSESAPQMTALSYLPAGLTSLEIIPSSNHTYWAHSLPSILQQLPAEHLQHLALDFGLCYAVSDVSRPEIPALGRFQSLRHLFWRVLLDSGSVAVDLSPLSPHLEALFLPKLLCDQSSFPPHLKYLDTYTAYQLTKRFADYKDYPSRYSIYHPINDYLGEAPIRFNAGSPYENRFRDFI